MNTNNQAKQISKKEYLGLQYSVTKPESSPTFYILYNKMENNLCAGTFFIKSSFELMELTSNNFKVIKDVKKHLNKGEGLIIENEIYFNKNFPNANELLIHILGSASAIGLINKKDNSGHKLFHKLLADIKSNDNSIDTLVSMYSSDITAYEFDNNLVNKYYVANERLGKFKI